MRPRPQNRPPCHGSQPLVRSPAVLPAIVRAPPDVKTNKHGATRIGSGDEGANPIHRCLAPLTKNAGPTNSDTTYLLLQITVDVSIARVTRLPGELRISGPCHPGLSLMNQTRENRISSKKRSGKTGFHGVSRFIGRALFQVVNLVFRSLALDGPVRGGSGFAGLLPLRIAPNR